jgi:hypothetical protein
VFILPPAVRGKGRRYTKSNACKGLSNPLFLISLCSMSLESLNELCSAISAEHTIKGMEVEG